MQAVAGVQERRELRVTLVRRAEFAVQVVTDRAAERVVVVEGEAERRDAAAVRTGRLGEARGLRPLASAVDALDREQQSHPPLGYEAHAGSSHRGGRLHRIACR